MTQTTRKWRRPLIVGLLAAALALAGFQVWRKVQARQEPRRLPNSSAAGASREMAPFRSTAGKTSAARKGTIAARAAVTGKAADAVIQPAATAAGSTPVPVASSAAEITRSQIYPLLAQAREALNSGDNNTAITLLNQVLEKDPVNAGAFLMLAGICRKLGLKEEELQLYQDWAKAAPDNAMPHYQLANYFQQQGRRDDAIAAARQFIAMGDPNDMNSYLLGANLFRSLNLPEDEGQLLESWVAAKPQLADAHRVLGEYYQRTGNNQAALSEYQAALEAEPGRWEINLQLGSVYQKMEHYDEAAKAYLKAIDQRPADLWIRLRLGEVYRQAGNNSAAIELYQGIVNAYPDAPEGKMAAARLTDLQR